MRNSKKGRVLLINSNTIKPLVSPIALDYVASSLKNYNYDVDILDLSFFSDFRDAIKKYFADKQVDVVGITVRNTDDCFYASQEFFIPKIKEIISELRRWTSVPAILGGCGFSIMPEKIMEFCDVDYGIKGEGEESFRLLVDKLLDGKDYSDIPGLVYRSGDHFTLNEPHFLDLDKLDFLGREVVNNNRYFLEGGQGNIETKRGCDKGCIYCADPVVKGRKIRLRTPQSVIAELESLYSQGVYCFHLCDSEFNNPLSHAASICEELIKSGLSKKISWYTYASPIPFSEEFGLLIKKAGCVGIDFGVDSGNDIMLQALGRDFTTEDIVETARICHKVGITFMYDLLLEAPGETKESIKETIDLMRKISPSRVGLSIGVRIYSGTKLAEMVKLGGVSRENENLLGCIDSNEDFFKPIFYLSSKAGGDVTTYVAQLIGDDKRFFFANPDDKDQNYNYNKNKVLVEAVKKGYRGAYWDILRRLSEESFIC
jgi:radical SAM superfamily enzyme YgiQ (UPF0313 family)